MQKTLLITALLAVIVTVSGFIWWQNQPCHAGCNVILIMVDTLSAKHLATYGYERDTMPKTTAFFESDGVIFENANSVAPWTLPSFNSMYFSDLPSRITFADLENGERPELQSSLRENGVDIRAVVLRGHVIFDAITRLFRDDEMQLTGDAAPFRLGLVELLGLERKDKPFFLLIHSFQAHDPYQPPKPYNALYEETDKYPVVSRDEILGAYRSGTLTQETTDIFRLRYDQQLSLVDDNMSEFLNAIPKDTLKDTVIIFASDHGEAFGEHDMLYHANSLFQEETHIPLMMRIPGVKPQRISEPVSLLDIAPTVLSFFNIPKPESFIGEDLKPLFAGGSLGTRAILSENGSPFFFGPNFNPPRLQASLEDAGALGLNRPLIEILSTGVRVGSHTAFFLYPTEQKIPKKHMGLHWYNLENDPTESENLATGDVTSLPAELREPLKALDEEVRPLN
jgi:hypothetical protein